MQKATPFLLVLILAFTAIFLSVRERPVVQPAPAAPVEETATPRTPSPAAASAEQAPPQASAAAPVEPTPWPQAASDIAPDAKAVYGTLENGLRYVLYPNQEPPKRLSIRLHIATGSLMEADDQQGLAHFIEHMVFNGTKNFKADELVPRMQRLGIAFGAHVNAYTSFDETVYMLDLPDTAPETVDLCLKVMRDFGDGALLEEKEIEQERGVILAEKISRDSVESRLMELQFKTLLPESLISHRFPIGIEDVIAKAPRARFVDYYQRYYTPRRMTLVIAGDMDMATLQPIIRETFGSMKNPENAGSDANLGPIPVVEGVKASIFADKEASSTELSLTQIRPFEPKPDTVENRIEQMPLDLAQAILSRRFERQSKQQGSPILSGSAADYELFNYMKIGSIDVTVADDRWQDAIPVLEQEFRRALQYGFTQAELDEAKSNVLNAYEQAVQQQATRKSETIATAIIKAFDNDKVFTTPETNLEIVKQGLAVIDPASVHDAFKKFWDVAGMHLILTTKEKPENAEQALSAIYQESFAKPITEATARAIAPFGYTSFGRPGRIATRKEVSDLGITQLVLSNQVRVNLKPTDFEQNKIRVIARTGSGQLTQPKNKPMLHSFASAVFNGGGLGKHSNDELQQILAGKNVGVDFSIGEEAFVLSGATTPADFPLQLQLMCATLTDPGYREEGLWQFQKAVPMLYQQLRHTSAGPEREMNAWLHGGDFRYTVPPMETLNGYTIADVKKWLTPELSKGYLELTIVGDFKIDTILPDLLSTFGSLPVRARTAPRLEASRVVNFPKAPQSQTFTFESKIPQAVATVIWKTDGLRKNQKNFRRLNILGQIYSDRLREEIREKLGASYSPDAGASGSDALNDFGYLIGQSVGKPEDVEKLLTTMRDLAHELSEKGATQDELDRALKPTLSMLDKTLRDNSYWSATVMAQSQLDPDRLELARTRDADYRSIHLEEINALAKKYLNADNALSVTIKPVE
ncbi:MAG: insulinase family protein [Luteolibacter sp.]